MTPREALAELLARLAAVRGEAVLVSESELSAWPLDAVKALKTHGLLQRAPIATNVLCSGCQRACWMAVESQAADDGRVNTFVVCDKREDINRVPVPVGDLEQWKATRSLLAGARCSSP